MAISFDAIDDVIVWGDINALDGLSLLTVAFWMYSDSTGSASFPGIIHKYDGESGAGFNGWGIFFDAAQNTNNILMLLHNSSGNGAITTGGAFTANAWHHFLMSYDGGQATDATKVKLYIDGSDTTLSFSGGTTPSSLPSITDPLVFGRNGTAFSKCRLAEVGMWPGVAIRDAAIIASLSNTSTPFSPLFYAALGLGFYADFISGRTLDRFGNLTTSVVGTTEVDHIRIMHPAPPMVSGKQTRGDLMGAMVF